MKIILKKFSFAIFLVIGIIILTGCDNKKLVKIELSEKSSFPKSYFIGDEYDAGNKYIVATYSDDSFEEIAITNDMVKGFDSSRETNDLEITIEYYQKRFLSKLVKEVSYSVSITVRSGYTLYEEDGVSFYYPASWSYECLTYSGIDNHMITNPSNGDNFGYNSEAYNSSFSRLTKEDYEDTLRSQLGNQVSITVNAFERVDYKGHSKSIRIEYTIMVSSGISITGEQYMVKHGDKIYNLTFTKASSGSATNEARKIIFNTFSFTE